MRAAYLDTSCVVAVALKQGGGQRALSRMRSFDVLLSSNLLEAELRAVLHRERVVPQPEYLGGVSWIFPDRSLSPELEHVLSAGYVRGADLWHLACAMYVAPDPAELSFLTLDEDQAAVAGRIGFAVE